MKLSVDKLNVRGSSGRQPFSSRIQDCGVIGQTPTSWVRPMKALFESDPPSSRSSHKFVGRGTSSGSSCLNEEPVDLCLYQRPSSRRESLSRHQVHPADSEKRKVYFPRKVFSGEFIDIVVEAESRRVLLELRKKRAGGGRPEMMLHVWAQGLILWFELRAQPSPMT